ncbi:hypothetical protein FNV43_RR04706 [Rhamnella rubrinervis]|uniref:Secreted protein n=1 Tax=Rhamnella rubrinervis TaxID=2594499 RepID=A0A8K0HMH1_9ROSA|nr:hypothetical protein FNV43_RR04706 [Rhamnella rubrinervis]
MAYGGQLLCLCALLSYALVFCSARNTIFPHSAPDQEMRMGMKERSLLVMTNDYGEATANRGHDPPSRARPSAGSVGLNG